MAETTSLAEGTWLSQGKTWKDTPPKIRRAGQAIFRIPESVQKQILPSPTLSIREMLQFTLPRHSTSNLEVSAFFQRDMPGPITEISISSLHRLPVPSVALVRKLEHIGRQAWLNGYQSIMYAHLGKSVQTHYPLWVLTFWGEVVQHRIAVREPWLKCSDWLQAQTKQKKSMTLKRLAEDANVILTDLPWGSNKRGLSDLEPIHTMHRYLGTSWTTVSQQNDMLELLRGQIASHPDLVRSLVVEGVVLTETVMAAAANRDKYLVDQKFAWLRHLGGAIMLTKQSLLTVAHIVNHRAALVVDVKDHVIRFGDSFGATIPVDMLSAYRWWLAQHTKETFETETLPMTPQTDTHSCGYLANNGLHHFAIPELFPLIQPGVHAGASARITLFNTLAEHVLERLAEEKAIQALADGQPESTSEVASAGRDGEAENAEDSDFETERASPPPTFMDESCSKEFTFRAAVFHQEDSLTNEESLKRPKGHPNGPTPAPSPEKKRVRTASSEESPPPFVLDVHPNSPAKSYKASEDVFGSLSDSESGTFDGGQDPKVAVKDMKGSGQLGKGNLQDYWQVETAKEQEQRHHREWERLRRDHEARMFQAEQSQMWQRDKVRTDNRERARRCRALKREQKIEAGWVPGQKRKHLEEFDNTSAEASQIAELSRPLRQFKENDRKKNKPAGRKLVHEHKDAKQMNWHQPFIWSDIEKAACRAGKPWQPRAIMREAKRINSTTFAALTEQVVGRWIDREAYKQKGIWKWKDSILAEVAHGNAPGGLSTRSGILESYPETRKKMNSRLDCLRKTGVPLTLMSIRGIMVACVEHDAPHLFTQTMTDGTKFKCSESFVQKYLRNTMNWSERRATRAAQKLPANHEAILHDAFLREAYVIRDHAIPAELRVNTDQTQTVYQQGTKTTWNKKGAKQVPVIGHDEKRAFTLVPSISASGQLLAMQAIYHGKSDASCPSPSAKQYEEAMELGLKIKYSNTKTYWSTQQTMKDLVNEIIEPYLEKQKRDLSLPPEQCSIWKIDCWSVHKSAEFLGWMKKTHPTIIVIFIPGRCTGVWQPLDIGIQRVLKQSIKRSAHKHIVEETAAHLESGTFAFAIKLDTTLGTLRDRSVGWIANAFRDVNRKDLILKAFEMCRVGNFNCSQASLTSVDALTALRNLPKSNPTLYKQFTGECKDKQTVDDEEEPAFFEEDAIDDGSDIPMDVILSHVMEEDLGQGFETNKEGQIERTGIAEDVEAEIAEAAAALILGRGKREKMTSTRYTSGLSAWEQH